MAPLSSPWNVTRILNGLPRFLSGSVDLQWTGVRSPDFSTTAESTPAYPGRGRSRRSNSSTFKLDRGPRPSALTQSWASPSSCRSEVTRTPSSSGSLTEREPLGSP